MDVIHPADGFYHEDTHKSIHMRMQGQHGLVGTTGHEGPRPPNKINYTLTKPLSPSKINAD